MFSSSCPDTHKEEPEINVHLSVYKNMFQLLMEIKEVWPSCFSLISFESCNSAVCVEQFGGKCSLAKTLRIQIIRIIVIIIINDILLNRKQGNVILWKQEAGLNKHPF